MQPPMVQMSFLDEPPPDGAAPVWAALDGQQQAEVVEALARLIAKVAGARSVAAARDTEEKTDE